MAFRMAPLNVGEAARTERVFGLLVSDGLLPGAWGAARCSAACSSPATSPRPGASPVAVVSHRFWQTRLAG